VVRALRIAESCRFCRFLSDLKKEANGEYSIETCVGPERRPLFGPSPRWYRVRFLIPERFPYAVAGAVPLDPALRWYPHQNGDWTELGTHANALCPPRQSEVYSEELLLPYVRHAHHWISDALDGKLTHSDQRYEFPHLAVRGNGAKVYAEGGPSMLDRVRDTGHGRAWLNRVGNEAVPAGLYRVTEIRRTGRDDDPEAWSSRMREGVFGKEEPAGWAAWAFVGDPVNAPPHRPYTSWEDFSDHDQRNIVAALEDASVYEHRLPVLLLAFAVPQHWGGDPDSLVWQAVHLEGFDPRIFVPPAKGFRPTNDPRKWPAFREFLRKNRDLRWLSCTDISREALLSRSDSTTGEGLGGLRIAVLGAGAVGSVLAKALSKLGLANLLLVDKERLEPGNLVRHEGVAFQVEHPKASSTATLLTPPQGDEPEGIDLDVVGDWPAILDRIEGYDLVIDATGDNGVHELLPASPQLRDAALAWCYVKPGPDFGLLVLRAPGSTHTLADAEKLLVEECGEELWELFRGDPDDEDRVVWPEPGCYHPTFRAPYHRIRMMSDAFLSTMFAWLVDGGSDDVATLFSQAVPDGRFGVESRIEAQVRW
jgi:ThiF family